MLSIFAAAITIAIVGLALTTPLYTARTLVAIEPQSRNLLVADPPANAAAVEARLEGEIVLARSNAVLLAAIDREHLLTDPEFGPQLGWTAKAMATLGLQQPPLPPPEQALRQTLNKLTSRLIVQRHRGTFLISISVSAADPDRATRLSAALAQTYIDQQRSTKAAASADAVALVLNQIEIAREQMIGADDALSRYIQTSFSDADTHPVDPTIAAADVATLRHDLAQADFSALADRLADEAFSELLTQRNALRNQLGGWKSPSVRTDLETQVGALERQLQDRTNARIASLEASLGGTAPREGRDGFRKALLDENLPKETVTTIYDLQQGATRARQTYDLLNARAQELQSQTALELADSRIASPAMRPSVPSTPNAGAVLAVASTSGIALALIAAILLENFVGGIGDPEQLARLTGVRTAATVPWVHTSATASPADTLLTDPVSAYADAIRRLRMAIERRREPGTSSAQVIMVTSTEIGEGKTTLAVSLARSLATAGHTTLLVDCDLRHPAAHRHLGVEASTGLADALAVPDAVAHFASAVVHDQPTGLVALIGADQNTIATDDLLTGRSFERLLKAARQTFEIVILDCPPIEPLPDTLSIARKADMIVYVVKEGTTPQQSVRRSLDALSDGIDRAVPLFPVLTQADAARAYSYKPSRQRAKPMTRTAP